MPAPLGYAEPSDAHALAAPVDAVTDTLELHTRASADRPGSRLRRTRPPYRLHASCVAFAKRAKRPGLGTRARAQQFVERGAGSDHVHVGAPGLRAPGRLDVAARSMYGGDEQWKAAQADRAIRATMKAQGCDRASAVTILRTRIWDRPRAGAGRDIRFEADAPLDTLRGQPGRR